MLKAMEHIRYLVDNVGYRLSGSEEERSASNYIKEVLEGLGMQSQTEDYQFTKSLYQPYLIIIAVSLLGALFASANQFLGFVITTLSATAFYFENSYKSWFAQRLPQADSQNVVGRISAAQDKPQRRVVLCAHYDTFKSGGFFHPRLVAHFRLFSVLTLIAVLGLPVFILCGQILLADFFGLCRALAICWLILTLLVMLHRELYGKEVHGANDNASGVGVILSLAEKISREPFQKTEVWIVATSGEEAGMAGIQSFLARHQLELQDALILNLTNLGIGFLKYITGEGMIKATPSDPELLLFSAEVVRENPDISLVPHEFRALPTSAHAALVKGYRAMSIMALDEEGVIPNWRWETDVDENLEEQNLVEAEKFVTLLLKKIDSER